MKTKTKAMVVLLDPKTHAALVQLAKRESRSARAQAALLIAAALKAA